MVGPTSRFQRLWAIVDKWLILGSTPGYYVSIMGIGITSNILYLFPYQGQWMRDISYIYFGIACVWFLILTGFMIWSVIRIPEKFITFHVNPNIAPFMGCFAMGYMTLINFLWDITEPINKPSTVLIIWAFWWVSVILSIYTAGVVFAFAFLIKLESAECKFHNNKIEEHELNLPILLPIVALTVAASEGNILLTHLPNLRLQLITIFTCFILWSIAVVVAFMIVTINLWKLLVHKLPPTSMIFTSFLPIGFLGQGAFGICLMGNNLYDIILSSNDPVENYLGYSMRGNADILLLKQILANMFVILCSTACTFMIAMGYFMTFIAVMSIFTKIKPFVKNPNPQFTHPEYGFIMFNRGFWSMTFPLGTMSLAQNELSRTFGTGIIFFKIMSCIYAVCLFIITTGCIFGVIRTTCKEIKQAWHCKKQDCVV